MPNYVMYQLRLKDCVTPVFPKRFSQYSEQNYFIWGDPRGKNLIPVFLYLVLPNYFFREGWGENFIDKN